MLVLETSCSLNFSSVSLLKETNEASPGESGIGDNPKARGQGCVVDVHNFKPKLFNHLYGEIVNLMCNLNLQRCFILGLF